MNWAPGVECPWCFTYGQCLHMTHLSEKGCYYLARLSHGVCIPLQSVERPFSPAECGHGATHLPLQGSNFVNIIEVLQAVTSKARKMVTHNMTFGLCCPHLPKATSHRKMDTLWGPAMSQRPHSFSALVTYVL